MQKKNIIIHGNCQMYQLAALLQLSTQFRRQWSITYLNYTESPTVEQLVSCAVYMYQPLLGEKWGTGASPYTLTRLNDLAPEARSISVPSIIFEGYWPFHTRDSLVAKNDINFGDTLLDALAATPYSVDEILVKYNKIASCTDMRESVEKTLRIQIEKEKTLDIKTSHLFADKYTHKKLFYSFIHPDKEIMLQVANDCLSILDYPPLSRYVCEGFLDTTAYREIPISPIAAEQLGLKFYKEDAQYNTYGAVVTWREYVDLYVKCIRKNINIVEIMESLHLYHKDKGNKQCYTPIYVTENACTYKFSEKIA